MQADPQLIAQLLATVALIGGTIEYREVMRQREQRRLAAAAADEAAEVGLRGLVRVLVADQ
jgi:hypothetical protein